jgi:hypothetical protein
VRAKRRSSEGNGGPVTGGGDAASIVGRGGAGWCERS